MKTEELEKILELHSAFLESNGDAGKLANLRGADLRGVNLRKANLRSADLRRANLQSADLRDANLWGATGNGHEIKSIQALCYPITYTSTHMFIGCEGHAIEDWGNFTFDEIYEMDGEGATHFWDEWEEFILEFVRKNPATPTTRENKK